MVFSYHSIALIAPTVVESCKALGKSHVLGNPDDLTSRLRQPHDDQRIAPRYASVAAAQIIETSSKTCVAGRVSEISRKGCYIDTLNPLPANTLLSMVISRDQGTFATKGKVIYVQ